MLGHMEKFLFCKVCEISVGLGITIISTIVCKSDESNGNVFPFHRFFHAGFSKTFTEN